MLLFRRSLKAVLLLAVLSICAPNVWAQDEGPIYYRIWDENYDDTPRPLEFSRSVNNYEKLYENSVENKQDSIGNGLSFLGMNHSQMSGESTNYAFYVDTAYVNRSTGWIKPQYMLAVDNYIASYHDHDSNGNCLTGDLVIGRYLHNTAMYARSANASEQTNFNKVKSIDHISIRNPNGNAYLHGQYFERLAFAWAIHKGDSLYVLKGANLEPNYKGADNDPHQLWLTLTKEYGEEGASIDFDKLISENIIPGSEYQEEYYRSPLDSETRTYYEFKPVTALSPGKTIGLHAIIALDDNTHKDWVFSFRIVSKEDEPVSFLIESETTDRDSKNAPMILPEYGGWIGMQNGIPVILRTDIKEISNSLAFTITTTNSPSVNNSAINDTGTTKATVIGGTGNVTILNAANKRVIISDILGRTITNTRASSDNISVVVPSGIIIVTIEGEKAAKVIVK